MCNSQVDVVDSGNLNGSKKIFQGRKSPSRAILIVADDLLSDTIWNRAIDGKDLWSTLVWWSCWLWHIHPTAGAWVWAVYLKRIVFWLVTTFMKDNFYVYIQPYLLNPAKELKLKPHLYKCDTAAHLLLGTIIFFRLCKSLYIYLFLQLVVPSEKT